MVRSYKNSDLDMILQIWLDSNRRAHHFIPESYWEENLDVVRDMLPRAELYVYEEDDGGIQGFVGLMDDYIAGIFVRREAQSKGIGKKLLDDVKLRKHGLTLHVYQKNQRAVSFYQREGFKVKSEGIDSDTGERELLMEWEQQENEKA